MRNKYKNVRDMIQGLSGSTKEVLILKVRPLVLNPAWEDCSEYVLKEIMYFKKVLKDNGV